MLVRRVDKVGGLQGLEASTASTQLLLYTGEQCAASGRSPTIVAVSMSQAASSEFPDSSDALQQPSIGWAFEALQGSRQGTKNTGFLLNFIHYP